MLAPPSPGTKACICVSSTENSRDQIWAGSAWRQEPVLGEDNFSKRSSASGNGWRGARQLHHGLLPYNLSNSTRTWKNPVTGYEESLWRWSRRVPSLLQSNPSCLVLQRAGRPPAMHTPLHESCTNCQNDQFLHPWDVPLLSSHNVLQGLTISSMCQ